MQVAEVVRGRLGGCDPVVFWVNRVSPRSRAPYVSALRCFVRWLNCRPGWLGVDARGLLLRQVDGADPYEVLDLLQEFVSGLDVGLRSKRFLYSAVRSFFMHNRVSLPVDRGFRIRAEKPPVAPRLTLEHVVDIVKGANLRDRSIILVKWQAMLDNTRTVYVGLKLAEQIVTQIRQGVHPVRMDLPERKTNTNGFFTFIGKDSVDALVAYFEKERGWPRPGEAIWLKKSWQGKVEPLTLPAFNGTWLRLIRRIGLIPKRRGNFGARYGYNPHEMRDIAKSLLHTHAKKDGFDMDCSEFWMGHKNKIDPLGYDKFFLDQEYVRKQYQIAEKYLNIISRAAVDEEQRRGEQEQFQTMQKEVTEMKQNMLKLQELLNKLQPIKTGPDSIR